MHKKKINVTQPPLPDIEELLPYLNDIWDSKQLTNGGQFHNELENKLAIYLGVPYVSLFNNGTLASRPLADDALSTYLSPLGNFV